MKSEREERKGKSKVNEGLPVIYSGKRLWVLLAAVVKQIVMLFSCSAVPAVPLLLPSRSMAFILDHFPRKHIFNEMSLKNVYLLVKLQGREEAFGKLRGESVFMCIFAFMYKQSFSYSCKLPAIFAKTQKTRTLNTYTYIRYRYVCIYILYIMLSFSGISAFWMLSWRRICIINCQNLWFSAQLIYCSLFP